MLWGWIDETIKRNYATEGAICARSLREEKWGDSGMLRQSDAGTPVSEIISADAELVCNDVELGAWISDNIGNGNNSLQCVVIILTRNVDNTRKSSL
jgi:hypothetical protein